MKILFFDIETSPNILAAWSLYDNFAGFQQIIKERSILCASWKWQGENKIYSVGVHESKRRFVKDVFDDFYVIKTLHGVLSKADVIVTQNGDRFDIRFFNARALYHGLDPVKPCVTIDTLKGLRKHFKFNTNKLDYVAQFLGLGAKTPTGGMSLWIAIINDKNPLELRLDAMKRLVQYNQNDVRLLEQLYDKISPWMKTHPSLNLISGVKDGCVRCLSKEIKKNGLHYTGTGIYQAYKCKKCGKWMRGTERIGKGSIRSI